jgi:hypothetical protein
VTLIVYSIAPTEAIVFCGKRGRSHSLGFSRGRMPFAPTHVVSDRMVQIRINIAPLQQPPVGANGIRPNISPPTRSLALQPIALSTLDRLLHSRSPDFSRFIHQGICRKANAIRPYPCDGQSQNSCWDKYGGGRSFTVAIKTQIRLSYKF